MRQLLARPSSIASVLAFLVLLVGSCSTSEQAAGSTTSAREQEQHQEQVRADYQRWWAAFLAEDPQWPEYRQQWLAAGPRDRERLLELLLVEMIRSNQVDEGEGRPTPSWKRCGREFRYLGSDAVRPLVESMKLVLSRRPVDRVSVDRLGRALGEVAEAGEVVELLLTPDAELDTRLATTRVLAAMQSPSSVDVLVDLAAEDSEWQVRAAAIEGLTPWAPQVSLGQASAFSRDALVAAMEDGDPFVRKVACRGLGRVRLPAVQYALVDRLSRARAEGDVELAQELNLSLEISLRKTGPADPARWLELIEDGGA